MILYQHQVCLSTSNSVTVENWIHPKATIIYTTLSCKIVDDYLKYVVSNGIHLTFSHFPKEILESESRIQQFWNDKLLILMFYICAKYLNKPKI